ncbi:MAG TPA: hypothetical protein VM451_06685 [Candidatus Limnocylindria bacterium]|nr:hypothetical protein [Candidatus Limnocylindria bacterium]
MARAKQTDRAEARRRYRQTTSPADVPGEGDGDDDLDFGERRPEAGPARNAREAPPAGRPSFLGSFRAAYRPANVREDLRTFPRTLQSRGALAALAMVIVGTAVAWFFWDFSGGRMAWELLVLPGSALAPQLVAGFFAPRASYLLGLLIGLLQGVAATVFLTSLANRVGQPLASDQVSSLLTQSFLTGPVSGALFASAAAWYRRFLAISQPNRRPQGRGGSGRSASKPNPSRRPAGR